MKFSAIPGWEGFYEASDDGEIYSVARLALRGDGRTYKVQRRKLAKQLRKDGYYEVHMRKLGISARRLVHRMVCFAFFGEDESKPFVNHKNGVKTDNVLSNLEWCTRSENALHSFRVLGNKHAPGVKGGAHHLSKKVMSICPVTGAEKFYDAMMDAVREGGFTPCGISDAATGRQKTHRSLIWKYI